MTTRAGVPTVLADYVDIIENNIQNQPRSLQKRIGPSELGNPCSRAIIHKLAGDEEPPRGTLPWKPFIGTAGHALLEEFFTKEQPGRWYIEQRVYVGNIGDTQITGSCDLFDAVNGWVLDHKFLGNSTLTQLRLHGPSDRYRIQAHLYGFGFLLKGHNVTNVAICALPRESEWNKRHLWHEPFDPDIAINAITRANRLNTELQELGKETALAKYPTCTDIWCDWCKTGTAKTRGDSLFN